MSGLAVRFLSILGGCTPRLRAAGRLGAVLLLVLALSPARAVSAQPLAPGSVPLRYLALNAGNSNPLCTLVEWKPCLENDLQSLRNYIATYQPDVVLLSEVMREAQLTGTEWFGPILPEGYDGKCGESRDRETGELAAWDAPGASHEHECVAWKTSRLSYVAGSARSAYARNDAYGKDHCKYDFTGFRVRLLLEGTSTLTAVAVHPNAFNAECRTEEIGRYWSELVGEDPSVVIAGDWNTELYSELQLPDRFQVNYSRGQHWSIDVHGGEYSLVDALGLVTRKIDHGFSSFGQACTSCGARYGTEDLPYGSALGGYDDHPRADGGHGFNHRQILADMLLPAVDLIFAIDTTSSMRDDIDSVKGAASRILDALASVSPQFRVAISEYRDFPVAPYGWPGDYPYRAALPFTNDLAAIRTGLNGLRVNGGNDWPESVYSGLIRAIHTENLTPWRSGVTKVVLVMGDAPPHDPEPFTGYTWSDVVAAANNPGVATAASSVGPATATAAITLDSASVTAAGSLDSAMIYGVAIGNDANAFSSFARLADATGGRVFRASSASAVVGALLAAVGDIGKGSLNRPPDCTAAQPSASLLWPAHRDMRAIEIRGATDPEGAPVSVTVTGITQDEPVAGSGRHVTSPDGEGVGTPVAGVRAERSIKGSGRVYEVSFSASDDRGGVCAGSVRVCVPRTPHAECVDDGQLFDSTGH